jgi:hypothetical protein
LLHQQEVRPVSGHEAVVMTEKLNNIMYNFGAVSPAGAQSEEICPVIV